MPSATSARWQVVSSILASASASVVAGPSYSPQLYFMCGPARAGRTPSALRNAARSRHPLRQPAGRAEVIDEGLQRLLPKGRIAAVLLSQAAGQQTPNAGSDDHVGQPARSAQSIRLMAWAPAGATRARTRWSCVWYRRYSSPRLATAWASVGGIPVTKKKKYNSTSGPGHQPHQAVPAASGT